MNEYKISIKIANPFLHGLITFLSLFFLLFIDIVFILIYRQSLIVNLLVCLLLLIVWWYISRLPIKEKRITFKINKEALIIDDEIISFRDIKNFSFNTGNKFHFGFKIKVQNQHKKLRYFAFQKKGINLNKMLILCDKIEKNLKQIKGG